MVSSSSNGDLNNVASERQRVELGVDPAYAFRSLAITATEDDAEVRRAYRPFLIDNGLLSDDWVAKLELSTAAKLAENDIARNGGDRLKVLVLYGSLRSR